MIRYWILKQLLLQPLQRKIQKIERKIQLEKDLRDQIGGFKENLLGKEHLDELISWDAEKLARKFIGMQAFKKQIKYRSVFARRRNQRGYDKFGFKEYSDVMDYGDPKPVPKTA